MKSGGGWGGEGGICEVCAKEIDTVESRVMTHLIRIGWLFMMGINGERWNK